MINSRLTFDANNPDDDISEDQRALNKFLESPKTIGLDGLKESLRNSVQLLMELIGSNTGYAIQNLVLDDDSIMNIADEESAAGRKKKKKKQFWDDLDDLERELAMNFTAVKESIKETITAIKDGIKSEIASIDAKIEASSENEEQAKRLKESHAGRKKLKRFKNHINEYKEDISDADNTLELIDIKKDIFDDVAAFENGTFGKQPPKKAGPLQLLGEAIAMLAPKNDAYYDAAPVEQLTSKKKRTYKNEGKSESDKEDSSKDDKSSSSDDDTSGKREEEEEQFPPPPTMGF